MASCENVADFWSVVIGNELAETKEEKGDEFQHFCNSVLLSALICAELGVKRRYLDVEEEQRKGPSPAANKFRRRLLERARRLLMGADEGVNLSDFVEKVSFLVKKFS